MSLKPDRKIQKILISSTCHFTGEFETEKLLITHAFPNLRDRQRRPPSQSRNAFIVTFRTEENDQNELTIPTYEHVGDLICSYLSVLYGKRFDNHGAIEWSGFFSLPILNQYGAYHNYTLPQNASRARVDFEIPLKFEEIRRLNVIPFGDNKKEDRLSSFRTACKYYWQALQVAEHDPEIAYLNLITAGEIISGDVEIPDDCLLDAETRTILKQIEEGMEKGAKVARIIRSKLRNIKRRFVYAILTLVDEGFFDRSESERPFGRLKSGNFLKVLSAAYDLRSRFVHTGRSFGGWIEPREALENSEIQSGKPRVPDKEYGKILAAAPTYIGMERIIRYALLQLGQRYGVDLSPSPAPELQE